MAQRPAVSCGPVPGFSREACRPARGRARSPCGDGSGARAAGRDVPGRAGRRAVKQVTSAEWPARVFVLGTTCNVKVKLQSLAGSSVKSAVALQGPDF